MVVAVLGLVCPIQMTLAFLDPDGRGLERRHVRRYQGIKTSKVNRIYNETLRNRLTAEWHPWESSPASTSSSSSFAATVRRHLSFRWASFLIVFFHKDILLNVFLAIAVDNLADAESLTAIEKEEAEAEADQDKSATSGSVTKDGDEDEENAENDGTLNESKEGDGQLGDEQDDENSQLRIKGGGNQDDDDAKIDMEPDYEDDEEDDEGASKDGKIISTTLSIVFRKKGAGHSAVRVSNPKRGNNKMDEKKATMSRAVWIAPKKKKSPRYRRDRLEGVSSSRRARR